MKYDLGNPITYSGAYSNSYNIGEKEQYYYFEVKGPKTKTTAELNATKIKVADLKAKINKVHELSNSIQTK